MIRILERLCARFAAKWDMVQGLNGMALTTHIINTVNTHYTVSQILKKRARKRSKTRSISSNCAS